MAVFCLIYICNNGYNMMVWLMASQTLLNYVRKIRKVPDMHTTTYLNKTMTRHSVHIYNPLRAPALIRLFLKKKTLV